MYALREHAAAPCNCVLDADVPGGGAVSSLVRRASQSYCTFMKLEAACPSETMAATCKNT